MAVGPGKTLEQLQQEGWSVEGAEKPTPEAARAAGHPEATIGAAPPGFGERMLSAVGPAIRGAGDVTGVNRLLEATGAVDPGRLTGDEANPRDASTRTGAAIGGGVAMGAEALAGLVKLAQQGGVPAVLKGVAAMTVVPAAKYELTKQALEALHFPTAAAIPIAMMVSGYQRGRGHGPAPPAAAPAEAAEAVNLAASTQAAQAARASRFGTPQAAPSAPAAAAARPPTPAPVASPAATEAVPAASQSFHPADALKQAKQAFTDASQIPKPGELSWVTEYIRRGLSAADAVQKAIAARGPEALSPDAELMRRWGLPQPSGNDLRFPKGMRGKSTGGYQ